MPDTKKGDRSSWWLAIVGVLGVVGGAVATGLFNHFDHRSDIDAKLIELSVDVLKEEPTRETMPLRQWAVGVLEQRGQVTFSLQQRKQLLTLGGPKAASDPDSDTDH